MDGLALLHEAHAAGLSVAAEGGRLRVRGPKSAGAVAARLLAAKPAVLAALGGATDAGGNVDPVVEETARNIAALTPAELVAYRAELAAPPAGDANLAHDRAALALAVARGWVTP